MVRDKVAVITGAGRGIGKATALLLAEMGAKVVVNDFGVTREGENPSDQVAEQVVSEIKSRGGVALANNSDISSLSEVERLVNETTREFGRIDILVNNAGIYNPKLFTEISHEEWVKMLAVHLTGTFNCIHCTLPGMIKQQSGSIVNVTSRGGLAGTPGHADYGAAKAGIMGLTLVLYRELQEHGIMVNAIAPGASTRMHEVPVEVEVLMERWGFERGKSKTTYPSRNVAMLIAYLASSKEQEITGGIFSMAGRKLGVWHPPALLDLAERDEWELDSIAKEITKSVR